MQLQQTVTVKATGGGAVRPSTPTAHVVFAAVHGHAQAIILSGPDARKIRR